MTVPIRKTFLSPECPFNIEDPNNDEAETNSMYDNAEERDDGYEGDISKDVSPLDTAVNEKSAITHVGDLPLPKRPTKKSAELSHIERRNWLIHCHYVQRDFNTCKALIKEQLDDNKEEIEFPLYIRGLVLRQEGKIHESLDTFRTCNSLNPASVEYIKQIARSLLLLGKHKNAIGAYDDALKYKQDDWEIHHWKGMSYYMTKNYNEAKECFKNALILYKHHTTCTMLAKILDEEGDTANAIEAYRKAAELLPEDAEILTNLGLLHLKNGSHQHAFEALGQALSADSSNCSAILAAGCMMQEHGDYDVALAKYRVAAAEMPDNAQLWSNVAMCFYGKKKFVAAISCLKRANYLAPFDWKILYNLGLVHVSMQQYASAFHFLSAAINLNSKIAIVYMTLAVTLTHLKDTKNAKQAYDKAAELDSKDPSIALNYSIFLLRQGDKQAAEKWLNAYEMRLNELKNMKNRGQISVAQDVQDMAQRLKSVLQLGGPVPSAPPSDYNSTDHPDFEQTDRKMTSVSMSQSEREMFASQSERELTRRAETDSLKTVRSHMRHANMGDPDPEEETSLV